MRTLHPIPFFSSLSSSEINAANLQRPCEPFSTNSNEIIINYYVTFSLSSSVYTLTIVKVEIYLFRS